MELAITPFESTIKNFLDNYAKEDKAFAKIYAKENKSIKECCQYIYQEVRKQKPQKSQCVACSDTDVYNLALHYYDEDDIKVDGVSENVQVTANVESTVLAAENKPVPQTKKAKTKAAPKNKIDEELPDELEIPLF